MRECSFLPGQGAGGVAGALGSVLKSDVARGLLAAAKTLSRHEAFFSPSVSEMVLKDCQAHDGHDEHGHRCHAWQPQLLLLASGSEVYLCVDAHEKLKAEGIHVRVVSMPFCELFRMHHRRR